MTIAADLAALARPVDSLKLLPGNPRKGDVAAVARSLTMFGQRKPITALPDGTVTAGNHTLRAAIELGWTEIAVVYEDDDEATAKAWALADNRTAELGSYDEQLLAEMIADVQSVDADLLAATGWSDADLAQLVESLTPDQFTDDTPRVFTDDEIIDEAFRAIRADGFPYPTMPRYEAMQEINALALTETSLLRNTTTAYHVADPYQPHRFSTPIAGRKMCLETFAHDKYFRHALVLALRSGKLSKSTALSALGYTRGTQLAAQFRPGFALAMYRRFAPPSGVVLDTSTGYGGRLVGFFASDCSKYIGIDPEPRTSAGNRALVADLCPSTKTVELIELPAEDVNAKTLRNRCDFAFTSPPYFGKEHYGEDDTQSWVRYPEPEQWRTGFLMPTMRLQYAALKSDAYAVLNIADVTVGVDDAPLSDWAIDAAIAAGFEHVRTERFPLPRSPGGGDRGERFEPLIILRKR